MTASFDLITQPWIPVVYTDGRGGEVGLAELFASAHDIRRIAGATPPMTAALHRLALAFLHRAYGPARAQDWGDLWKAKSFKVTKVGKYATSSGASFDLFDPQRPFLQCPELPEARKSTVAKLIPDLAVGNNVTLFDHTVAGDRVELTPGEAARWLVTAHAYDPGGMKTPATTVKSSKRAPCNSFAVVLVEGSTLKETLLLNAARHDPKDPVDVPAWERPVPGAEPDKRRSDGWTDVLTWPSRRVRLFPETRNGTTVVAEAILSPGTEFVDDDVLPQVERMAAYRTPLTAGGRPKPGAPMLPVRLRPVRGAWRHSVELLLVDPWREERSKQRPVALKELATHTERGRIPDETVYTLRMFGQQLDKNASVVEAYFEEAVPAPVALIRAAQGNDDGENLVAGLVGCAIELADESGAALRIMQREYHKEMRAIPGESVDLPYWPELPRPFGRFLRELNAATAAAQSERRVMDRWQQTVGATARRVADDWAEGVAASGRSLRVLGKHQTALHKRLRALSGRFEAQIVKYLTKDDAE
ncbi:type I-E CRISPR-associated protein Cse1/CasA [Amycolatopsis sp. FU40]|uniref:type I-E CRISPR-associated protein Cse1/CasA n=1 Tax=Amycolatopsis sp. FU40 TaxID=2914159 RepID=UPI001F027576|nr:type I-E CRISPR-associated protein Cse1/CasA [Amycolatopsis sp. FU40]UKD51106.1 type I-E CRISPR-associated protein Cse1/CasA [Amycolatopsis sp. FU40]